MRWTLPIALSAAALFVPAASARQAGDLEVEVRDDWVGGERGGYWPVRVSMRNLGPRRAVTAAFLPYEGRRGQRQPPSAVRTVILDAGAATRFTLPLPLTAPNAAGVVVFVPGPVPEDGESVPIPGADDLLAASVEAGTDEHTVEVRPPRADEDPVRRPATLVLAGTPFEEEALLSAADVAVTAIERDSSRPDWRRDVASDRNVVAVVDPADGLPETWLPYTTVDLVVASPDTLRALGEEPRAALATWLLAGGAVAVVGDAADAAEAERSLGTDAVAAAGDWRAVGGGGALVRADREAAIRGFGDAMRQAMNGESPGAAMRSGRDALARFGRTADAGAVRARPVLAGRLYAVPGGEFGAPGAAAWLAVFDDLGPDRLTAADRFGVGGRGANREFYEFLIPGVRGVPGVAFVVLITLFAVGIGPVNYFLLKRRHRVGRLAVTIPAIAAATGAVLLGYALVMHGFAPKSRQFSVTVHDPGTDRAVTFARTAVFAPRAPSGGLDFAPDAAVLPLPAPGPGGGGGRVDWTDGQRWADGLFRGRTRTQFVTVAPRAERGRLTAAVSRSGETVAVTNGYADDFDLLIYAAPSGVLYAGRDVPAGGAGTLAPIVAEELFAWRTRLDAALPAVPPGMEEEGPDVLGGLAPLFRRGRDTGASFRPSLLHRTGEALRGLNERTDPVDALAAAPLLADPAGAFVAVLKEPEELEFGGLTADARGGVHVLIGVADFGSPRSGGEE